MVVSRYGESTEVVRLKYVSRCGKSTIKVWRKYAGSKAQVRLKNSKSTVKYEYCTETFFWRLMYTTESSRLRMDGRTLFT